MTETFASHLVRITHDASVRQIAAKAAMQHTTLRRQIDGESELKVGTVVDICRAYDADLLPAFVAAGFITENEAGDMSAGATLRDATDRQLVEELLRRIIESEDADAEHPTLVNPVTDALIDAAEELIEHDDDTPENPSNVGGGAEPVDLFTVDLTDEPLAASEHHEAVDPARGES